MKLTFIGTRGNIEARPLQHFNHTALWIGYRRHRVAIDCGGDWLSQSGSWDVDAIVLTHGHPDHVDGLKQGAPVHGLRHERNVGDHRRIPNRSTIDRTHAPPIPDRGDYHRGVWRGALLRTPRSAIASRPGARRDLLLPGHRLHPSSPRGVQGISAYIGDGATISRSMVHRRDDKLFGHAPLSTQLSWCRSEGVARAIFTHCGTEIVTADRQALAASRRAKPQVSGPRRHRGRRHGNGLASPGGS